MAGDLFIIDDSTPISLVDEPGRGRGLDLSARPRGYAYGDVAEPFPASLLVPRSEWQARIQERKERKTQLSDLLDQAGIPVKDQGSLNYCWAFSPTHCVEILRAVQGESPVTLSATAVGALVTGYRNVGGYGLNALKFLVANGAPPAKLWPEGKLSQSYATEANKAAALRYRAVEWWEGEPRNLDEVVSCLLRGIPVSAGLNWWGHQVTYLDPVWLDGTVAILFNNSWGPGWGTNGRGVLQGNRMLADDAVMPRTALAGP